MISSRLRLVRVIQKNPSKWIIQINVVSATAATRVYRARQKVQNSANFSRIVARYDVKFCTLVTHSIIRKSGKFHYIIYRIDKIALLLVMATWQLW